MPLVLLLVLTDWKELDRSSTEDVELLPYCAQLSISFRSVRTRKENKGKGAIYWDAPSQLMGYLGKDARYKAI